MWWICKEKVQAIGPVSTTGYQFTENVILLTLSLCVSGSAITPMDLRWKSPMLRVIARRPLTLAWPTLFHVTNPPDLWILDKTNAQP